MTLKLIRIKKTVDYAEGIIQSDGLTRCHTAENARYCLPEGTYDITMRYCKMRECSVLFVAPRGEVPACDHCKGKKGYAAALNLGLPDGCECPMPVRCPQLAVGNGVRLRTDGSIIVGTAVCPGVVKLSARSYKSLYSSIKRGIRLGFSYQLEVVETDTPPSSQKINTYGKN